MRGGLPTRCKFTNLPHNPSKCRTPHAGRKPGGSLERAARRSVQPYCEWRSARSWRSKPSRSSIFI